MEYGSFLSTRRPSQLPSSTSWWLLTPDPVLRMISLNQSHLQLTRGEAYISQLDPVSSSRLVPKPSLEFQHVDPLHPQELMPSTPFHSKHRFCTSKARDECVYRRSTFLLYISLEMSSAAGLVRFQ